MPANPKYLTSSPFLRTIKILVGFIGGYVVSMTFHLMLTQIFPRENVTITAGLTAVILWVCLMIYTFIAKSVWRVLCCYLLLALLFSLPFIV